MSSTGLNEPSSRLRKQSRLTQPSHGSSRYIKIQERTKTLIFRLLLLGIYITSGAAIFHVIESHNEDEKNFCHASGDTKVEIEMAKKFNVSMKEIKKIVEDLCMQFEETHRCKYSHNDWSYYQSLYFVGSVTTTIGYGHLAPKTQAGRLFLIFYAFFGIPINLLALQSVGEHINVGFHKLITFTEKKLYKTRTIRHEHIKTFVLSVILMILMLPIGGLMYYYSEHEKGWTYLDSVYYSFVAMSTIGFGDLVPNEGKEPKSTYEQVMWFIRLLFLGLGLSLVSSVFTSVSGATKQIKTAYMSKKGMYQINSKQSHKPVERTRSFKQAACIRVKGLLCNENVERPSRISATTPTSDVYSRFEDSVSTTSLSLNQSQHDDHVNYLEEKSHRGRSISLALSHASLGFDCTLDWDTSLAKRNSPNTTCNTLQNDCTSDIEMNALDKTINTSTNGITNITGSTEVKDVTLSKPLANEMTSYLDASSDVIDVIDSDDSTRNETCARIRNSCKDDVISNHHVIDGITT